MRLRKNNNLETQARRARTRKQAGYTHPRYSVRGTVGRPRATAPLSGTATSKAFTDGTDETIFIFKELYRGILAPSLKKK